MVCLFGKVQAKRCQGGRVILDCRVSVVPQNPSIAIDMASSSCSRTVTTVFAGKLVELESLLVLNINLGKVEAERCQGGDSRSDIVLQKAWTGEHVLPGWRPAFVFADACPTHGGKSGMWRVWEWLSRKKMTATDTTVFCFGFQILLLYGGYPQRSPVWILREGETPVPGRSCTSTTSAADHHTRLRHFLGGIAHRRSKKKKQEKAKNSYGLHLCYLYIEHKAVERKNKEVLRNRRLFTQLQTRTSIRNERQWSFAWIFFAHNGGHQISPES